MSSLKRIILLLSEMSAGTLMKESPRSVRGAGLASAFRSPSPVPSARRRVIKTWVSSIGTGLCESKLGGKLETSSWSGNDQEQSSPRSTCSSLGDSNERGCYALLCVRTATSIQPFISRSVSQPCPCQGRPPYGRPCYIVSHISYLDKLCFTHHLPMIYDDKRF